MASRSLWSKLPLFLLLAPALAVENDFSFYPKNSQDCLYDSADSAGCTSGTISKLNTCLCGNNNDFIINTAKCLGKKDSSDVNEVYSTMSTACSNSNTPLSVTKEQFEAAAEEGKNGSSSTTTDVSSTATQTTATSGFVTTTSGGKTVTVAPTQTGGNDDDDKSSGLSTGATIGIGVGAAAIGAAIVGAIVFCFLRRRRRKGEESHPMLPHNSASTFPPTDPAHGTSYSDNKPPLWTGGATPSPDPSKGWQTPVSAQHTGPYGLQQPAIAELPPTQSQVFEMDGGLAVHGGHQGAVEMPTSHVHR